jgi:hypothetical protein
LLHSHLSSLAFAAKSPHHENVMSASPSRYGIGILLLIFCMGMGAGWFAHRPQPADSRADLSPSSVPIHSEKRALTEATAEHTAIRPLSKPAPALQIVASPANLLPDATEPASASEDLNALDPDGPLPAGNLPNSHEPGQPQTNALDVLLSAISISCQFDPGYSGGWSGDDIRVYSAAWQGGLIVYDSVDLTAGKARMTGSEGATGSKIGEVKVRAAATSNGLYFSGFSPRGDLITTTVFAERDKLNRYMAVMSSHATEMGHNSSQFHGRCNTLP